MASGLGCLQHPAIAGRGEAVSPPALPAAQPASADPHAGLNQLILTPRAPLQLGVYLTHRPPPSGILLIHAIC